MISTNNIYMTLIVLILFLFTIFLLVDINIRGNELKFKNNQVHDNLTQEQQLYKFPDDNVRFYLLLFLI